MVRRYYPKRPPWRDKDQRMTRVAELRALGWSLRKIANRLVVSHQTVARDLARWERERPNVTALSVTSNRHKVPPAGRDVTPECDSREADVLPIRRSS